MRQCLCGSEVQYGMCVFMFEDLSKRIFDSRIHFCCHFWCLNIYPTSKVVIRDKIFLEWPWKQLPAFMHVKMHYRIATWQIACIFKVKCRLLFQDNKGCVRAIKLWLKHISAHSRAPFVTNPFLEWTTTGMVYCSSDWGPAYLHIY